ncbi:unnamed protein product [Moneuplotes crassus]|uniref:Uncharacterized protein n=1 Tax=Euplotes crassus TaxID=5936 RepID=A0AAD1XBT2_EUPCR|nr:unnamed protein product [Moneuplotes crassus]
MYKRYICQRVRPQRSCSRKAMCETANNFHPNQGIFQKLNSSKSKMRGNKKVPRSSHRNLAGITNYRSVPMKPSDLSVRQLKMMAMQLMPSQKPEAPINKTFDPKRIYQNGMSFFKKNSCSNKAQLREGVQASNSKLSQLRLQKISLQKEILQNSIHLDNLLRNICNEEDQENIPPNRSALNLVSTNKTSTSPECTLCHCEIPSIELSSRGLRQKPKLFKRPGTGLDQDLAGLKNSIKLLKRGITNAKYRIEKEKIKTGPLKAINQLILKANKLVDDHQPEPGDSRHQPVNIQVMNGSQSEIGFFSPCKQYLEIEGEDGEAKPHGVEK